MKYVEDHWELDGHNRVLALAIGLTPIWMTLILAITNPTSFGPDPTEAQRLAALRVAIPLYAIVGVLMVAGTVGIWRARAASVANAAMLLLTLPALLIYVFGPAIVLILGNMAASSGR